jgi:hypothetical protein
MNDEVLRGIELVIALSGGAGAKALVDLYKRKKDKGEKAEVLDKLYTTLEEMYSKDMELQKEINRLAVENDNLKMLLSKMKKDGKDS